MQNTDEILVRHHVREVGRGSRPLVLVHGYGCNQAMWREMVPHFTDDYRVILMDHIGTAATGLSGWDKRDYQRLDRYADDVAAVVESLDLREAILVGHSVSAMICGLALRRIRDRVSHLVMVAPSPRYLNDADYVGGFERADVDGLLEAIESNYLGWSRAMAPAIMGRPDAPDYGEELTGYFCEQDPEVAHVFARATFLSDNRADLHTFDVPTLVLQCVDDLVAPPEVGAYLARELPNAHLHHLEARGHCPNLSAPAETADAIRGWLSGECG